MGLGFGSAEVDRDLANRRRRRRPLPLPIAGRDAELGEARPEWFERPVGVTVERRSGDPLEGPSRPLEHCLASAVGLPAIGSVPRVTVAFDREPGLGSLDHDVDAVAVHRVLHPNTPVASGEHALHDLPLEVRLTPLGDALDELGQRGR